MSRRGPQPTPCFVTLAGLFALLAAPVTLADPVSVVNELRNGGCARVTPAGAPARRAAPLDAIAAELARGTKLADAMAKSRYPAASSTSFHVRGSSADADVRRILADKYCAPINERRFSELGVFQRGADTWIVLAEPKEIPPPLEPVAVERRVLALVNAARATPRKCGRDAYAAAGPVVLSRTLSDVALAHALEMAARGVLEHRGADGSNSAERITRAGYAWQAAGENIAAGQQTAEAVVAAWLSSPGHCATLMGPRFTEMGIAFALAPSRNPSIYWTQLFATPR